MRSIHLGYVNYIVLTVLASPITLARIHGQKLITVIKSFPYLSCFQLSKKF